MSLSKEDLPSRHVMFAGLHEKSLEGSSFPPRALWWRPACRLRGLVMVVCSIAECGARS